MLSRIEKGEAVGILAWHPDRLARNSIDGGQIIYMLDTEKIKALKFPTFWFEPTSQGKFMLNMMFGQSKYYVDSLAENVKRGLRQKCRNGWCPGFAPTGYMNDVRTKTIVVDKRTAPVVKKCFELYATGTKSCSDIADILSSSGVVIKSATKAHGDAIKNLLTNSFYRGIFSYAGETWEGKHELFISQELFDKVQFQIKHRGYTISKHYTLNSQAYMGLLRCSNCGQMITGEHLIRKNKNGKTREYVYYHCARSHKTIKCKEETIREIDLDKQISDLLIQYSMPKSWAEFILSEARADNKLSARSQDELRLSLQENREQIDSKLSTLLDLRLEQEIDNETYVARKKKLQLEKKSVEAKMEQKVTNPDDRFERIKNWLKHATSLGEIAISGTMRSKNIALRNLTDSNAYFGNGRVQLKLHNNPKEMPASPYKAPTRSGG
jgi:DNA invertase Pin-like site-specific DNA recombinase